MKTDLYNLSNKVVGEVELPQDVFGVAWKPVLVEQVSSAQLANKRVPWAHAKTRAEVRGGGRKPWRQKGTGRARHGSIRSPLWVGGGKAHGPNKARDYSEKVNKKMRRLAITSVLSRKFKDGEVKILENFELKAPKTKLFMGHLKSFFKPQKKSKKIDLLIIPELGNKNIFRAAANLVKTKVLGPSALNVYDLLTYKHIFIAKDAVPVIGTNYRLQKK